MKISDFDFELPEELIAQHAVNPRDHSKLLVLNKKEKTLEHKKFYNIIDYLKKDDILVINRTKVIPARLFGHKENGVVLECFLLKRYDMYTWEVLLKPAKKLKIGQKLIFLEEVLEAELLEIKEDGNRIIKFSFEGRFEEILDKLGEMPLPPYIMEKLEDKNRYQTVYAKEGESVAAPTAGLHFTNELLEKIREKGVIIAEVFLDVGLGTFRPVQVENVLDHKMHSEKYRIPEETAKIINEAKEKGNRVIAVGTTSVRTLESSVDENGKLIASEGDTNIFIYGDYNFKIVDAIITNFHLPKSTLIMLISSFGGKEFVFEAYKKAIEEKYRFYSFGDSMFIY
ncbi:tRNA preQ1(34) S-adenosylmethionine ribosyltransferase-isomerase QueA [Leptotrichia trevisanii]|uniref:S-adenosylmethionine:tRNA ribosyltransferase-isomerase n=1 Tax=Leptotrichia trevisanii TaxID=109328 RepID=A0A510JZ48_9FUSO|nr:tRNA preQ1(34) S-adenosylmethionine ribosyltransferase-isomerase QueA [Leptotrichia trevisanii]BBM44484.1 S-adenosylmethionine-tRNA ribosyltransferase-isomerase [Leptotrichia trevisanii]